MARIRSIKPEFFDSPGTTMASPFARLLYIAMWCWADDWGIGDANPRRLLGFAFPEDDASEVEPRNFRHLAAEVADCYGVKWYEIDGREYYAIPSWEEHQRTEKRAKRRFPGPDQAQRMLHSETSEVPSPNLGTSVVGRGKGEQGKGEKGGGGVGNSTTERDVAATLDAAGLPPWEHDDFLQALKDGGIRKTSGYVMSAHRDGTLVARVKEWQDERDRAARAPRVIAPNVTKTKRGPDGAPVTELCAHEFEVGRCPECRAEEAS